MARLQRALKSGETRTHERIVVKRARREHAGVESQFQGAAPAEGERT